MTIVRNLLELFFEINHSNDSFLVVYEESVVGDALIPPASHSSGTTNYRVTLLDNYCVTVTWVDPVSLCFLVRVICVWRLLGAQPRSHAVIAHATSVQKSRETVPRFSLDCSLAFLEKKAALLLCLPAYLAPIEMQEIKITLFYHT